MGGGIPGKVGIPRSGGGRNDGGKVGGGGSWWCEDVPGGGRMFVLLDISCSKRFISSSRSVFRCFPSSMVKFSNKQNFNTSEFDINIVHP